jgi:hypothetical protein
MRELVLEAGQQSVVVGVGVVAVIGNGLGPRIDGNALSRAVERVESAPVRMARPLGTQASAHIDRPPSAPARSPPPGRVPVRSGSGHSGHWCVWPTTVQPVGLTDAEDANPVLASAAGETRYRPPLWPPSHTLRNIFRTRPRCA